MTTKRLLVYQQLEPEKGIRYSRQHLARLEKADKFPRRVQIGPGRVGWWEHEIDERELRRGPLPITPSPRARRKRQPKNGAAK